MRKEIWIFGLLLLVLSFIFDSRILNFVNLLKTDFFVEFFKIVSYSWMIALGIYLFVLVKSKKKSVILLVIATILTYLISVGLKFLIMRERPEGGVLSEGSYSFVAAVLNSLSGSITGQETNFWSFGDKYGFPSIHASLAFSAVAFMNREFPNLKWVFVLIASMVAFSRLYLGVHYTSDLVAGGFLGFGIGLVILEWKKVKAKIKSLI